MKKYLKILLVVVLCMTISLPPKRTEATPVLAILEIIKEGVKKVIKAVDLKIQRKQNKVIWLQNAQKVLENTLSKLKLEEIAGWADKQKEQYREYFEELQKVKTAITYYQRLRDLTRKQLAIVEEYQRMWEILVTDQHFAPKELAYMAQVYSGMLEESLENVDMIALVVESFTTQMSDAQRLQLINKAAARVDEVYSDMKMFNSRNTLLSLQRAKTERDAELVKRLYGIE